MTEFNNGAPNDEPSRETAPESLRDAVEQYAERGRLQVQSLGQSLEQQIRRQPLPSLLIAAGVGFLLGMLWNRGEKR